jgi:hypothetical protein
MTTPLNLGVLMKSSTTRYDFAWIAIFLGCAVCCALLILASVGLAGVATAAIGWASSNSAAIASGIIAAVAVLIIAIRGYARRRAKAASCEIECKTDQSCCGPKRST